MEELIKFAEENGWAALGVGIIVGLYVLGKFDIEPDDDLKHAIPDFKNIDEEIAFHEKRAKHLRDVRAANKKPDELLDELLELVQALKTDVNELKSKGSSYEQPLPQ